MASKTRPIPEPRVRSVALNKIKADPDTFQPRSGGIDPTHAAGLLRVLEAGGTLDPMDVMDNGDGTFTVLDGHHRRAAYIEYGRQPKVPVRAYRCTVLEGERIAGRQNSKLHLNMDDDDKNEWSWRRVCKYEDGNHQGGLSLNEIASECGNGTATVSRQRSMKRAMLAAGEEILCPTMGKPRLTWREALRWKKKQDAHGGAWSDEKREEMREARKAKLKKAIAPAIYHACHRERDPEATMETIQELMGHGPFKIGNEWLDFKEVNPLTGAVEDGDDESDWQQYNTASDECPSF
ncbi:MAG: ParB/RepB/Spo0J family partition protein [Pseudomonadota bacterium]